jgi:hypothetical protein
LKPRRNHVFVNYSRWIYSDLLVLNQLAEIATAAAISKLLVLLHAVAKEIEVWQVDAVEGLQ